MSNIIETYKYLNEQKKKKKAFPHYGLKIWYGGQGEGKTISAVRESRKVLTQYPKATFITNVKIKGIKNKTYYFADTKELLKTLDKVIDPNNIYGYVVLIDEIHIAFASMFNKGIDPEVLKWLSQQRKTGIYMLGTTQQYGRLPKAFRDYVLQSGQLIICHKIKALKILQINQVLNMDETYEMGNELVKKVAYKDIWLHDKELYESYDTYAVISMITSEFNVSSIGS